MSIRVVNDNDVKSIFEGQIGQAFSGNDEDIPDGSYKIQVFALSKCFWDKASEPPNAIEAEEFEANEQAENEFEGYDIAYRYDHNTVDILDNCHFDPELAGNFDCDEHANQQTNEQPIGGCASDTCAAPTTALSDFYHVSSYSMVDKVEQLYQILLSKHTKTADAAHLQQVYKVIIGDVVNCIFEDSSSGITVAKVVAEARRQANHMITEFVDNPGFNISASKVVTDLCEQFVSYVNKRRAAIDSPSGALP
ncbi:hypothetical protein LPJ66_002274, partial [Kickxella alabastrina]